MKKNIICMIIICTLFIFSGCGGGGGGASSNTPVTISVSFQNNHASSLNTKDLPLTHVRYTVTGPKMQDMQGTVPVIGDAADIDLMVPSGTQRLFKIQILDSSGAVVYFGDTTADLKGDPIKLEIQLHSTVQQSEMAGTWAHVALERMNDGTWGSILETVIFRNDGTGSEINRRVNYGGNVSSFNRIDFSYTTSPNQDGSMNLTMVYSDRTITHRVIRSDNRNMVIIDRTADTSSKRMDVAIKMDTTKSYTTADFVGDYYAIGYSYDANAFFNPGLYNTYSATISFDGIGEYGYEATWHSDEIVFTDSKVSSYSVINPDGSIMTGDGNYSGYLGESGLFITSHPTINSHWKLTFEMQKGDKIYSTADLAGTWAMTGFGDANAGNSYGDIVGTMTCNTTGNCQAVLKNQKDGDVVTEQVDFIDIPVDPDGSFGYFPYAISPPYGSAIGNNGNTVIMNMSFGQSELYDREILIGVRCSNCSNLAGQGVHVKTKKVYHFKKRSQSLSPQDIRKKIIHHGKIG